ncbi:hypothetical protein Cs7R123_43860 [Catellatospora sp. TT07R-123]|nr:hypothetical protein Cs7R123_43860 [Catellatospora sp. TT07R-123]
MVRAASRAYMSGSGGEDACQDERALFEVNRRTSIITHVGLRTQGLLRHIGISDVHVAQVAGRRRRHMAALTALQPVSACRSAVYASGRGWRHFGR